MMQNGPVAHGITTHLRTDANRSIMPTMSQGVRETTPDLETAKRQYDLARNNKRKNLPPGNVFERQSLKRSREIALQSIEVLGQIINDPEASPQHRIAAARLILELASPKRMGKKEEKGSGKLTFSDRRTILDKLTRAADMARERTVTIEATVNLDEIGTDDVSEQG